MYIIGLDEVGRGALAGPVTVAAVCIPVRLHLPVVPAKAGIHASERLKLKDSKKLSPKQREAWFLYFKNHPRIEYAVARVYPRVIERMNISAAANRAAQQAYKKLITNCKLSVANSKVFLDGGLYLANRNWQMTNVCSARTVVKGDEKIPAVAMASIVAKVTRDRAMVRLAKKYAQYGFDIHKGYGTKMHSVAIRKYGPCKMHRLTFLS
ncbi:MAG TPA: ribonuclease HII [Candidatus Paceibacterota bacterium]|nr:ribonuclease HII [Candidatus Paceibacterota bacterium]